MTKARCRERTPKRSKVQIYKAATFEPPLPVIDRVFIGTVLAPPISDGGTILLLVEGTSDVTPAGVDAVAILSVSLTAGQRRQTCAVRCHPCHACPMGSRVLGAACVLLCDASCPGCRCLGGPTASSLSACRWLFCTGSLRLTQQQCLQQQLAM